MKFLGVTILQGVEFPIFPLIFAWALQQYSATALLVICFMLCWKMMMMMMMIDARFSHLYFCQSLYTLQRGLPAIAGLLVLLPGDNLSSLPIFEFVPAILGFVTGVADTALLWSASNKTFQTRRYNWTPVRDTSWKWPTSASTCPSPRRRIRRSSSHIPTKTKRACLRDTVPSKHWHAPAATATRRSPVSSRPSVWLQALFQLVAVLGFTFLGAGAVGWP